MTDNIIISKVEKELIVKFSGKKKLFSEESKSKIQENWNLKNSKSNFFNGKMYTIANIHEKKHMIEYIMDETDYAHYLYTDEYDNIDELCKIIFVSAVIYSSDNKFILGKMSNTTASPGRIQCIGGNIDGNILVGNNFDITKTILQEIQDELQKHKIMSELSELVYVDKDTESIELFCVEEEKYLVDYLPKLLIQAQKN